MSGGVGARFLLLLALTSALAWQVHASPFTASIESLKKLDHGDPVGPEVTKPFNRGPSAKPLPMHWTKCGMKPLWVDPITYDQRCQPGQGPCFHFNGNIFDLTSAIIEPWYEPVNMTDQIAVKDDKALDFTVFDPSVAFQLTIDAQFRIRYSEFTPGSNGEKPCYKVELEKDRDPPRRLTAGGTPGAKELDTKNAQYTSTQWCYDDVYFHFWSF